MLMVQNSVHIYRLMLILDHTNDVSNWQQEGFDQLNDAGLGPRLFRIWLGPSKSTKINDSGNPTVGRNTLDRKMPTATCE